MKVNITVEIGDGQEDLILGPLQDAAREGYGILLGLKEGQSVVHVHVLDAEEAPA